MSVVTEQPRSLTLAVEGMHCGGCVKAVTRAVESVPGAVAERVAIGSCTILVAPGASEAQVVAAIRAAGYEVRVEA